MTNIFKCGQCGETTVHICAPCADQQQYELSLLKKQRDDLLAAVQYAADVFSGYVDTHKALGDMGAEAQGNQQHLQMMLEAIAKAGGES